ncbi:MAG: TolC family protein [Nitrospira sp.]
MRIRSTTLAVMVVYAGLSACVQGANYERPAMDLPSNWSQTGGTVANFSADQHVDPEWWRAFQNDELSGLIEQALQQNHDVKRAVARLLEGRAAVMSASAGGYPQINLQGSYSNIAVSKNTLAGLGLASGRQPGPRVFATPGSTFGCGTARWIFAGNSTCGGVSSVVKKPPRPMPGP